MKYLATWARNAPELGWLVQLASPTASALMPSAFTGDWNLLLLAARQHGLLGMLSRRANHGASHLRRSVDRRLASIRRDQWSASQYLQQALASTVSLARGVDVDLIAFKGPTLGMLAYPDPADRPGGDLDFLVHPKDASRLVQTLLARGFSDLTELPTKHRAYLDRTGRQRELRAPNDTWTLDLHWDTAPRAYPFRVDPHRVWARSRILTVANTTVRVPSPEETFLLLCVHGTRHNWSRLLWLSDVAWLAHSHPAMDWDYLSDQLHRQGLASPVNLGAILSRELLGFELGPDGSWLPEPSKATRLAADRILSQIFVRDLSPFQSARLSVATAPHAAQRLAWLLHRATTPSLGDFAIISLPKQLFFLYGAIRPIRYVAEVILGHGTDENRRRS